MAQALEHFHAFLWLEELRWNPTVFPDLEAAFNAANLQYDAAIIRDPVGTYLKDRNKHLPGKYVVSHGMDVLRRIEFPHSTARYDVRVQAGPSCDEYLFRSTGGSDNFVDFYRHGVVLACGRVWWYFHELYITEAGTDQAAHVQIVPVVGVITNRDAYPAFRRDHTICTSRNAASCDGYFLYGSAPLLDHNLGLLLVAFVTCIARCAYKGGESDDAAVAKLGETAWRAYQPWTVARFQALVAKLNALLATRPSESARSAMKRGVFAIAAHIPPKVCRVANLCVRGTSLALCKIVNCDRCHGGEPRKHIDHSAEQTSCCQMVRDDLYGGGNLAGFLCADDDEAERKDATERKNE